MGSESHWDENMSEDLTLFSSPELKDVVQGITTQICFMGEWRILYFGSFFVGFVSVFS